MWRLLMEGCTVRWRGSPRRTDQSSWPSTTLDWTVSQAPHSAFTNFCWILWIISHTYDIISLHWLGIKYPPPSFVFFQTKPAGTRSSTTRTCRRSCSTLLFVTSTPWASTRALTPFPLGEPDAQTSKQTNQQPLSLCLPGRSPLTRQVDHSGST